ncbi:MAG: hypothetical protein RLP15_08800 [Cryomorphaceae bacterium]
MMISKTFLFFFLPLVCIPFSGDDLPRPFEYPGNGNVCKMPDAFTVTEDLYELELRIEQDGDAYYLVTTIDFFNGSYTASPLSNNDFTGLLTTSMDDNPQVRLDEAIDESPRSIQSVDLFSNDPVNWLKERATYRRVLHIEAKQDFDAGGKVTFTIEPRCTFEVIPFLIKNRGGSLSIEKWEC